MCSTVVALSCQFFFGGGRRLHANVRRMQVNHVGTLDKSCEGDDKNELCDFLAAVATLPSDFIRPCDDRCESSAN